MATFIDQRKTIFDKFPTIRTPHLELVQITEAHAGDLYKIFCNEQEKHYYNLLPPEDEQDCHRLIAHFHKLYQTQTAIRWGIRRNGNDNIIGTVGYNNFTKKHRANIGYDVHLAHVNQETITEALYAVISFGFFALDINRIEAEVIDGNTPSIAVMNKIGFRLEGTLRQWMYWNDKHYDMLMFSLLRSDAQA